MEFNLMEFLVKGWKLTLEKWNVAQDTKSNIQALWEKEGPRLMCEVVGGWERLSHGGGIYAETRREDSMTVTNLQYLRIPVSSL